MQPWVEKASSSSSTNTSSLHFDKTLSYLNNKQSSPSLSSYQQPTSFRTTLRTATSSKEKEPLREPYNNEFSSFASHHFSPPTALSPYENPLDGSDVLGFLNSTRYCDEVHGDDLRPDSMSYISHRHQQDTQQALSEVEKLQQHWTAELLASEDIVEYLQNADYTEDIYGIPVLGRWIRQAKQEAMQSDGTHKKVAIERLAMIRQHLIQKAMGDRELAAKNASQMTQNDWSSTFLDSSF